jgi:Gpi18-like mannosyltransferase
LLPRLASHKAAFAGLLFTLWSAALQTTTAVAASNLVLNGDLSEGRGRLPAHWHPLKTPGIRANLRWIAPAASGESAGALEIDNRVPTIGAWRQELFLRPGWYHVSAEVRVEDVPVTAMGAVLLLAHSNSLAVMTVAQNGTTNWTPVGFFVREPRWSSAFAIGCDLGIDRSPSSGRAWFRKIEVVPVDGPDTSGERVFDMGMIDRLSGISEPAGIGADQVAGAIIAVVLAALLAWGCIAAWRPGAGVGRDAIVLAVAIAVVVFLLQMIGLAHFEGFYTDIQAKSNRAVLAAFYGPSGIYDPRLPADFYPPGSVYALWLTGAIGRWLMPSTTAFRVLVETPPLVANALIALTIFFIGAVRTTARRALILMLLFALNPGAVYDTVIWGQSDSMYALPMLLALVLVLRGRSSLGWALEALAILVKPQAVALAPVLGVLALRDDKVRQWLADAAAFAGVIVLAFIPFQIGHPPRWLLHVYSTLAERYPQASAGAFNLLALLGGWRVRDLEPVFLGVPYIALGMILALAAFGLAAWVIWRGRDPQAAWLGAFIALFGFFLLAPRMHERYAYAALLFLVPLALDAPIFLAMYVVLTASFLGNLGYNMLTNNDLAFPPRMSAFVIACIAANLAVFAAAAAWAVLRAPTAVALARVRTRSAR